MSKIRHLVDYFIPEHYQLNLDISKSKRHFSGTVVITGQPLQSEIRLHAKQLDIKSITDGSNRQLPWRVDSDELVINGQPSKITVEFAGTISETSMNGLYLCKYKLDGKDHELFATQFESHYARQCFPCIDEPAAKATFDISITTDDPDDKIVLSNMPGKLVDGVWKFNTTPRMSTYLIAFVGGDLISKAGRTKNGVTVSTYATPAQPAESLDFALQTAIKSVEFYEDYFGVTYPLPKLDNVALPDFSAGAMENWGLITYRETAMLVTDGTAESSKESIATTIAHEISHQWFGNLVTMKWWNDLWLNESFASLMEYIAIDHIYPEFNIWDEYELGYVASALKRDSMPGVQSVQQEVETPDEIATLFDSAIVYAKGERLLKMLRACVGEDVFRHGLTNYFTNHQYTNTEADDLWQALSDVSSINVKQLMDPWLTRPGYPIIHANLDGNQLTLRQEEFVVTGQNNPDKLWPIPLFSGISELPAIMDQKELTVNLDDPTRTVNLNANNQAHYIVHYDDNLIQRLIGNFSDLSATDKLKLIRESLLLSSADIQDISQLIKLLNVAKDETNQAIVTTVSGGIGNLSMLVEPDSIEQTKLERFAATLFQPQFNRLFGQSSHDWSINDRKSVSSVLARSVYGKVAEAISFCRDQFTKHQDNLANIPGDIRSTVLSAVVKNGNNDVFDELWQQYQGNQDADLRLDICAGLTATTSHQCIAQLLAWVTDSKIIKPQDVVYFIAWLTWNKYGQDQAWQWTQDNWNWIKDTFGGDMSFDDYVRIAGNNLHTEQQLVEFDNFFSKVAQESPALRRSIQIGHDSIVNKINWIKKNRPVLNQLLD